MAGARRVVRGLRTIRKGRKTRAKALRSGVRQRAGKLSRRVARGSGLGRRNR